MQAKEKPAERRKVLIEIFPVAVGIRPMANIKWQQHSDYCSINDTETQQQQRQTTEVSVEATK